MKSRYKIVGALLVTVYVCYFLSAHLFVHSHVDSSGRVVHSHPYASSDHTHTQSQLNLIEYLSSTANSELASNLYSVAVVVVLLSVIVVYVKTAIISEDINYALLRGPPAL